MGVFLGRPQNPDGVVVAEDLGDFDSIARHWDDIMTGVGGTVAPAALDSLRDKEITFFMLANQLPLLQAGQTPPAVSRQNELYCGDNASKMKDRWFKKLSVVAFSDPNDILSYTIPQSFSADFMDSRLCATTTNVVVAVAKPVSLAVTSMASPQVAHTAYDADERVLGLMTYGLG